jgi:hypothetical protein
MSCSTSCLDCACINISVCRDTYYSEQGWYFLWEMRLWSFNIFYSSLVVMLFTHDPWFVVGTASIVELAKELSVALSVVFNLPWISLKKNWQPGDIMFNLLLSTIAAFTGAWIIKIVSSPRLIIYPYEDIHRISHEYGINMEKPKIFDYASKRIMLIRWKYFFQLLLISWLIAYVFYLQKDEYISPSNYETDCGRLDWALYLTFQSAVILVMYFMNMRTRFEYEVIWKRSVTKYNIFYFTMAFVLLVLLAPSVCMFREPKVVLIYTVAILIGLLIILHFLVKAYLGKYFNKNEITMVNGRHYYASSEVEFVPRTLINKMYGGW